jgi:Recombination endonuclease VII
MRKIGIVALTQHEKNVRHYEKHRDEELARNKAYYPGYYEKNQETIKAKRRNRRHNITQEWFDAKLIEQDNRCAICRQPFTETPHIDHNHKCCPRLTSCNKCRRDLLCEDCNLGLGRFKDNAEILLNAVEYARRHNGLEHKSRVQEDRK